MEIIFFIVWTAILFVAFVMLYALLTLLGTIIPLNSRYRNKEEGIAIFVSSTDVHTDFVLPAINHLFDWSKIIPSKGYQTPLTSDT